MLSVEPYGMKPSASRTGTRFERLSVLSVEPYGMKPVGVGSAIRLDSLSVLSVEPYGMKPRPVTVGAMSTWAFSALGRAVWDETV